MELVEINKIKENKAEIKLKIADKVKRYSFSYSQGEIFAVDFPEELRRILRMLPAPVTHALVEKIEQFLTVSSVTLPYELEIEKEILQLV